MPIKRNSCRVTERTRMRRMAKEGYTDEQISNAVSVNVDTVNLVTSGKWDKQEKLAAKAQQAADEKKADAARQQKIDDAAAIAAATAQAIKAADEQKEAAG